MEATVTLNQAGEQLGVDDATLTRLIRMGALPEARQEPTDDGTVWVIPEGVLPSVAARNGWTIDLRGPRAAAHPPAAAQAPQVDETITIDGESAAEATTPARESNGALVLRADAALDGPEETRTGGGVPSVSEVVDLALLDRLLGAQEQKVVAESQVRETRNALAALNTAHNRVTGELEIERHERMVVADRFREERLARAAADAKVTELRNRVTREMALAEAERQAKAEAVYRSAKAERDAANAFAAMGWLGRRRYRRLTEATGET
jgi:hypothetical protein